MFEHLFFSKVSLRTSVFVRNRALISCSALLFNRATDALRQTVSDTLKDVTTNRMKNVENLWILVEDARKAAGEKQAENSSSTADKRSSLSGLESTYSDLHNGSIPSSSNTHKHTLSTKH